MESYLQPMGKTSPDCLEQDCCRSSAILKDSHQATMQRTAAAIESMFSVQGNL